MNKKLRRLGVISLVLAQTAATGFVMPTSAGAFAATAITRGMENLDRGVVAVKTDDGVFLSWRRLGTEPANTNFEVYRNKEKITEGAITNFVDTNGTINDFYTIVSNGTMSKSVAVLDNNYIEIPLQNTPDYDGAAVTSRQGVTYGYYAPGDGSYADLDGDGEYEIIFLWNPSDAKDAASGGRTGKVYMDAYKLDGTFMWRIDMGWNIRAGAHDTMLTIADFDGNGCAEVMVRTADGTKDGQGNVIGDASRGDTYENSWAALNGGKNLQGPLYVSVFDGKTGKVLDTMDYFPQNTVGSMETSLSFGDDFGNRSERYNATIAYLDGELPSVVFGRGYYFGKNGRQRQAAAAYDFRNGKLSLRWTFDTEEGGESAKYVGQGNHQMEAADVDGDGKDEVSTGALWYDDNGKVLWSSQLEHGDSIHIGDFDPRNPGLEMLTAKEDYSDTADHFSYDCPTLSAMGIKDAVGADLAVGRQVWGIVLQDAKTGKFLQVRNGTKDTGRGVIANIGYGNSYYVMWGAAGTGYHDQDGNDLGDLKLSMNGRIYWTGDLQDELQDHRGAGKEIVISKWNDEKKAVEEIFVPEGSHSVNSTKGNTTGQADLIGDWREEFVSFVTTDKTEEKENVTIKGSFGKDIPVEVVRTKYQYALRVYTTTYPTKYNFYTLSHDDVYRNSSAAYNNCYNQPPHISWYMNDKMEGSTYTTQPAANIKLIPNSYKAKAFDESSLPNKGTGRVWNQSTEPAAPGEDGGTDTPAPPAVNKADGVITVEKSAGLGYFTDCITHWARPYIDTLYTKGLVSGVTETTFNPNGTVTKGEFLKLVVGAAGVSVGTAPSGTNWAAPYFAAAVKNNLIPAGMDMKASELNDRITREEMAALVCAAAKSKGKTVDTTPVSFTDGWSIDKSIADYVYGAANLGLVGGYENGSFNPQGTATRAEAATMVTRLVVQ